MDDLVINVHQPPLFEQCVVSCGSKNEHQEYTCAKGIGLNAQNTRTIISSIINIIGGGGMSYMTI